MLPQGSLSQGEYQDVPQDEDDGFVHAEQSGLAGSAVDYSSAMWTLPSAPWQALHSVPWPVGAV